MTSNRAKEEFALDCFASKHNSFTKQQEPQLKCPENVEEFLHPYTPYKIQSDFMSNLYRTIESGKIGIFESPTGTGKTLSLICGSLKWLKDNSQRYTVMQTPTISLSDEEPDWVLEHEAERMQKIEVEAQEIKHKQHEDRLRRIKERERGLRRKKSENRIWTFRKRQRLDSIASEQPSNLNEASEGDDDYLVDEYESGDDLKSNRTTRAEVSGGNFSAEVKGLLEKFEKEKGAKITRPEQEEEEPDETKIIFCSRTHSQLSQFVQEFRRTAYTEGKYSMRSVSLASRKSLCIHEPVRRLGNVGKMNEKCVDIQKKDAKPSKRCPNLPKEKRELDDFKDVILADIHDIEELSELGKSMGLCPYYGSRTAIKSAHIVTMPYNLLLQEQARKSLGISLRGNIVIIDEAHNLIDTITQTHSVSLTANQIRTAQDHLRGYLSRYKNRLKGKNVLYIRQILLLLNALAQSLLESKQVPTHPNDPSSPSATRGDNNDTDIKSVNSFVHDLRVDAINLFKIEQYMKESEIAKKLCGFAEKFDIHNGSVPIEREKKTEVVLHSNAETEPTATPALHQVQSFLMCLTNADRDGRILVSRAMERTNCTGHALSPAEQLRNGAYVKYMLLNPANQFKDIVQEARSVILAGGTMEPVSDYVEQLLPYVPQNRIHKFSCGHIVPAQNMTAMAVSEGPSGRPLEFTFEKRGDTALIDELGQIISNVCNVVPHGVVCFLVSYGYMNTIVDRWGKSGLMERLKRKKKVFVEPRQNDLAERTLADYAAAIEAPTAPRTGCLLLSVVGGKMSEGINFSDNLGRCVVMVGLPYPNLASPELQEKIRYMDQEDDEVIGSKGSRGETIKGMGPKGQEYYENLCMRSVNQSIGRAIRHENDYACILLLDRRFASARILSKLPDWISRHVSECSQFGHAVAQLGAFFRNRQRKQYAEADATALS